MNTKEKMAVQPTNEIVARMLQQRNKGTEDCITSSEYARKIGMTAPDLNHALIDLGILERNGRELGLTLKYQGHDYAKKRSAFHYSHRGQLKEIVYPVWTPDGVEFLDKKLKIKK